MRTCRRLRQSADMGLAQPSVEVNHDFPNIVWNFSIQHAAAFAADAVRLTPKMKSNRIRLAAKRADEVDKPWLLVGKRFANTWGSMRWPLLGEGRYGFR